MSYADQWEAKHAERLMYDLPLHPVREFFDHLPDVPVLKVLDVGCGTGSNALWLAQQGYHVYAIDGSSSAINRMLTMAIRQGVLDRLTSVIVADLTKPWPYPDEKFDVVLDVRALENLDAVEIGGAFKEVARVLKPDGRFFSLTASEDRSDSFTACGHARKMTDKDIFDMCASVGLRVNTLKREFSPGLEDWAIEARRWVK